MSSETENITNEVLDRAQWRELGIIPPDQDYPLAHVVDQPRIVWAVKARRNVPWGAIVLWLAGVILTLWVVFG